MKSKCPTKLLLDLPANEDAFGSHERIAKAIAELIASEVGGKSIALTGPWGSGKSTVVSLLKELFRDGNRSPKCEVFVFDAWSHQGDPLRRSFLERLIGFLVEKRWVDSERWHQEKEKLSKRLIITETSEVPRLTSWGIWWACTALLVPVGLASFQLENVPRWTQWIGLLLVALPFVSTIMLLITANGDKRKNMLQFLVSRAEKHTRNETITTPEPTSIEFQQLFNDAIKEALEEHRDRRLLIVIDNLDRVDPHDARAIWSTMRTFFDNDSALSPSWRSRFWLLVPYDPSSLTRLWPAMKEDTDGDTRKNDEEDTDFLDAFVDTDFLDAFTEKTFQIQFRVSAPVFSDWKQFFMKHLEEALPQHTNEIDTIYRLYRSEGVPKRLPITPRDIKMFLNDLGSLHRQQCDQKISLVFQAIYVLYREDLESNPKWFAKKDFLSVLVRDLLPNDSDWQKYLAALHFNVPPEKAMQVVLRPVLDRTLPKGDADELAKYASVPAFSDHIDYYLAENCRDWAENQPETLARAASVLEKISEVQGEWKSAWQYLSQGAKIVSQWHGLNKELAEGISLILKREEDESCRVDLAGTIVRGIRADPEMKDKDGNEPDQSIVETWVDGAMVLCRAFTNYGCRTVMDMFQVPGSANTYLTAVSQMAKKDNVADVAQFFQPEVDPEQIVSELSRLCQNGTFTHSHLTVVETMVKINRQWPLDELVSALNQRIEATADASQPGELNAYLGALLALKYRGNVSQALEALQTLSMSGVLFRHLHYLVNTLNEPSTAAQVVFALLDNLPTGDIYSATSYNTTSYVMGKQVYESVISQPANYLEIVEHLSVICLQFAKVHVLVNAFKQTGQTKALVSEVLRHAVFKRKEGKEHFLSAEYLLEEYGTILQLMDDESLKRLIMALLEHDDLISLLKEKEFSLAYGKLYALAYAASNAYAASDAQKRPVLDELLIPALRNFGKDQWLEQLQQEGDFLQLLFSMINAKAKFYLAQAFHDALLDYTQRIIDGEITPTQFAATGTALLKMFNKNWQKTFADNLWDLFEEGRVNSLTNFLKFYGDFFFDSQVNDAICDRIVRCWLPGMVDRGDVEERERAAVLLEKRPELFKSAFEHSRKTFKERIVDRLQHEYPVTPELERIARAVGISPEEIIAIAGDT